MVKGDALGWECVCKTCIHQCFPFGMLHLKEPLTESWKAESHLQIVSPPVQSLLNINSWFWVHLQAKWGEEFGQCLVSRKAAKKPILYKKRDRTVVFEIPCPSAGEALRKTLICPYFIRSSLFYTLSNGLEQWMN